MNFSGKKRNVISKKGRGGSRPFGNFPKKHQFLSRRSPFNKIRKRKNKKKFSEKKHRKNSGNNWQKTELNETISQNSDPPPPRTHFMICPFRILLVLYTYRSVLGPKEKVSWWGF